MADPARASIPAVSCRTRCRGGATADRAETGGPFPYWAACQSMFWRRRWIPHTTPPGQEPADRRPVSRGLARRRGCPCRQRPERTVRRRHQSLSGPGPYRRDHRDPCAEPPDAAVRCRPAREGVPARHPSILPSALARPATLRPRRGPTARLRPCPITRCQLPHRADRSSEHPLPRITLRSGWLGQSAGPSMTRARAR